MTTHLESLFTLDAWEPAEGDPLTDPDGAGPPTGRATVRKTYSGALTATSVTEILTCRGDQGAAYLAQERVVGELDGRRGSFVLQHGASGGEGQEPAQWAFVVAGSGTGDLAGLQGRGVIAHELLTLDYALGERLPPMAFTEDPDGTHRYRTTATWSGSTGVGYDGYARAHRVSAPPATAALELSNDPRLGGDASRLDPEQLVLAATSSCQLLSFLAIAARARIDVTDYRDDAEAVMSHDEGPARIAGIVLRPWITVAPGPSIPRVERLVELAHKECYVANSLATPVAVEPVVTFM